MTIWGSIPCTEGFLSDKRRQQVIYHHPLHFWWWVSCDQLDHSLIPVHSLSWLNYSFKPQAKINLSSNCFFQGFWHNEKITNIHAKHLNACDISIFNLSNPFWFFTYSFSCSGFYLIWCLTEVLLFTLFSNMKLSKYLFIALCFHLFIF